MSISNCREALYRRARISQIGANRVLVLGMVAWAGIACGSKGEDEAVRKPSNSAEPSEVLEGTGPGAVPRAIDTPAASSNRVEVVLRTDRSRGRDGRSRLAQRVRSWYAGGDSGG